MFRIGEFSKIAQVSGRLLRYYDKIDLLKPSRIDSETGYRYYTAAQLPRLNRILALKELGLTLDQIAGLLHEEVSAAEIRGMLTMKKAQIEQTLHEEISRLRNVELRLSQIEQEGKMWEHDVVLKSIAPQLYLSIRETGSFSQDFAQLFSDIKQALPAGNLGKRVGHFVMVIHSPIVEDDNIDMEMGFLLDEATTDRLALPAKRYLTVRELPGVETMATIVQHGLEKGAVGYNALGSWIEANGFQIVGPGRELFLRLSWPDSDDDNIMEIQLPVAKVATDINLLSL